jgi:hypothetical protein
LAGAVAPWTDSVGWGEADISAAPDSTILQIGIFAKSGASQLLLHENFKISAFDLDLYEIFLKAGTQWCR